MKELQSFPDVWLIGAGGKTTLMFRLAATWTAGGESVVCTTSTRIWPPTADQCTDVRLGPIEDVTAGLARQPAPLVTVASGVDGGKLRGFSADDVMSLRPLARHLLVEADGSAGRPIKAHAPHEPVVSPFASCVVAVVGAAGLGAGLGPQTVHRPELFSMLTGCPVGEAVSARHVAQAILGDGGWVSRVPATAALYVFVTGPGKEIVTELERHPNSGLMSGVLTQE